MSDPPTPLPIRRRTTPVSRRVMAAMGARTRCGPRRRTCGPRRSVVSTRPSKCARRMAGTRFCSMAAGRARRAAIRSPRRAGRSCSMWRRNGSGSTRQLIPQQCRSRGSSTRRSMASRIRWPKRALIFWATPAPTSSATAPRNRTRWLRARRTLSILFCAGPRTRLAARLNVTTSVMHVAQPPEALAAIAAALDAYEDPVAVAALSVMTTLTGSALLALAVARGFLSARSRVASGACRRGLSGRALGRGCGGGGASRGALARVRGGGSGGEALAGHS